MSWLSNWEKALCKKRPFPGMCLIISSLERIFVTLQRVPPVKSNFRPKLGFLSNRITSASANAALTLAISPLVPPPTTMTFINSPLYLYS